LVFPPGGEAKSVLFGGDWLVEIGFGFGAGFVAFAAAREEVRAGMKGEGDVMLGRRPGEAVENGECRFSKRSASETNTGSAGGRLWYIDGGGSIVVIVEGVGAKECGTLLAKLGDGGGREWLSYLGRLGVF
jgi:hypothetical protein